MIVDDEDAPGERPEGNPEGSPGQLPDDQAGGDQAGGDPAGDDPAGDEPAGGDPASESAEGFEPDDEEAAALEEELEDEGATEEEDEEEDEDPDAPKAKADEEEVVKHPDTPVPTRQKMLEAMQWAFEAEEDITQEFLERCTDHALATLEKNRVMNLTAIFDPREVAAKHYLDSWRVTRLVPLMARKVLDLGTGAGYPGLPIALAEPNLSMTVVDSAQKKITFVEECIKNLGLKNTRAVWARAEDHLAKERVDVVLVRAVSSVRENVRVLRKVRHSLQDLVMLKGKTWSREVRAAERETERLGFKLDTVWEHELPGEMGARAILVYRAPGGAGM